MRPMNELTAEIEVGRDAGRSTIELKIPGTAGEDGHTFHLSREDARRLAALILFQSAQLDRSRKTWTLAHGSLERRSA